MSIDDRLLVTLEKAIGHSFNHLSIYSCTIDRNLNQQRWEIPITRSHFILIMGTSFRFTEILISARPNHLNMYFECEASFFDLNFLKNYTRVVPFPTISLSSLDPAVSFLWLFNQDILFILDVFRTMLFSPFSRTSISLKPWHDLTIWTFLVSL